MLEINEDIVMKITNQAAFAVALVFAFALAGCGGGGGSKTAATTTDDTTTTSKQASSYPASRAAAAKATGNQPKAGSATQSSNGDKDNITTDSVEVDVTYKDGQLAYTGTKIDALGAKIAVSSATDTVLARSDYSVANDPDSFGGSVELYKKLPDGKLWVDIYTDYTIGTKTTSSASGCGVGSSLSAGDSCTYTVEGGEFIFQVTEAGVGCVHGFCINAGQSHKNATLNGLFIDNFVVTKTDTGYMITGIPAKSAAEGDTTVSVPDADYLAGGIWVYAPDDATNVDDYEFGAFVDGNDPYNQDNLITLTGSAKYNGEATGVYADTSANTNTFFDADVALTADFGAADARGTINGRITNFTDSEDDSAIAGNPTVTLGMANIGDANSGFFTGDTSMTFDKATYTGKWGGQFYGNGAATDQPGSVAGTFGGATANSDQSFLGVFGAHKSEDTQ